MGRWLKDQKERKKQELRTQNAQLHAAVSVAGVAAAVAAVAASTALPETSAAHQKGPLISELRTETSAALASAAALVASRCIEIAEEMGADHDHILSVVNSAVNARTNGDIMTLTAGAATGTTKPLQSYTKFHHFRTKILGSTISPKISNQTNSTLKPQ